MRASFAFLALLVSLGIARPSRAAENLQLAQDRQPQTKKIWTNDDMDLLRARGLISITGPDAPVAQQAGNQPQPTQPLRQVTLPAYGSRLADPRWYAEQAATLQAELDRRQTLLRQQQQASALAPRGITQPGVALDKPSYGATPQDAVANLTFQVAEVRSQLDGLADLARQNDIPPGVLRG